MDKQKVQALVNFDNCAPYFDLACMGVFLRSILDLGVNKKLQIVDLASYTQCKACANLYPTRAITVKSNILSSSK